MRHIRHLSFLALLAVLAVLAVLPALAGNIPFKWTAPTSNTDGTTIGAQGDSITKYTAYYGICAAGAVPASPSKLDIAAPALTATLTNLVPAQYCFQLTATNNFGSESDRTNVATSTVVAPKPMPPGGLMLAANTLYQVIGGKDRFAYLPVGTVDGVFACDATQPQGPYYVLPLANVDPTLVHWFGNVRPPAVVASCS